MIQVQMYRPRVTGCGVTGGSGSSTNRLQVAFCRNANPFSSVLGHNRVPLTAINAFKLERFDCAVDAPNRVRVQWN
jgi:hypothetical protein